jgi:3-hydroxybutyrate dehydrogenase
VTSKIGDLDGTISLVTGGARGIGLGISRQLLLAGSTVIIGDLNIQAMQRAANQLQEAGGQVETILLNVTDHDSVKACAATAITQFGRIDVLVNNAGIFQRTLGLDQPATEFNSCLDVNLTGMWRMTQEVVPHFRRQGGGKIVNVSSVGGRLGVDFAPGYCAAKAGVINLTQSLAALLAQHKVNVNAVCPGTVETAMQEEIRALIADLDPTHNNYRRALLAAPVSPEDIGNSVVFLASDKAKSITGQALNVDGGFILN